MAKVYRSALVAFSCQQMFELVNGVEQYPEFLPDCADAVIKEQSPEGMIASVKIQKAGLSHWFTTKNEFVEQNQIRLALVDGPFKQLSGAWSFTALSESACKVELTLEFEFSNKLVSLAFGPIFNVIANNLVQVFCDRAKQVF